jgi:hypothetical protein
MLGALCKLANRTQYYRLIVLLLIVNIPLATDHPHVVPMCSIKQRRYLLRVNIILLYIQYVCS